MSTYKPTNPPSLGRHSTEHNSVQLNNFPGGLERETRLCVWGLGHKVKAVLKLKDTPVPQHGKGGGESVTCRPHWEVVSLDSKVYPVSARPG